MNKKIKNYGLLTVFIMILLLITSCSSSKIKPDFYELDLQVAGEGDIKDSYNHVITDSRALIQESQNSIVEIEADPHKDSEFLFWTGDVSEQIINDQQSIYMNRDKEIISVFGDPENVYMAGYITESWGYSNVIGYWKALMEFPHLEIYLRETGGGEEGYRYIFDKGDFKDDPDAGEIIYYQPDKANSEYIGALMRIEESNNIYGEEATRYLFVYADIGGISVLVLEDTPGNYSAYLDIINENDNETFITKINNLIYEKRDEDVIVGITVDIFDQDL